MDNFQSISFYFTQSYTFYYVSIIIEKIHTELGHIDINRLEYEVRRRGIFWNNISKDIREFVNNCIFCITRKLNKTKKPNNKQILSFSPLERIEIHLTYLQKLYPEISCEYKYILSFIDHFSKYIKVYLLKNKTSKEVLKCIKSFIYDIGKPEIFQSDNEREFCSNDINNFLKDENIIFIHSAPHHTQGAVQAFNKNIIKLLETILIGEKEKFNI